MWFTFLASIGVTRQLSLYCPLPKRCSWFRFGTYCNTAERKMLSWDGYLEAEKEIKAA